MKTLFSVSFRQAHADVGLLLLRVAVGASMLTHGIPKLITLLTVPDIQFPDPLHVGPFFSLVLAVFAEAFCSFALILGFGTRLVVLPLMFTMAMAVLIIHAGSPYGVRELATLYFLLFSVFLVLGPGNFSADALLSRFLK